MRTYLRIPLAAFSIAQHADKDKMHKRTNVYTWGAARRSRLFTTPRPRRMGMPCPVTKASRPPSTHLLRSSGLARTDVSHGPAARRKPLSISVTLVAEAVATTFTLMLSPKKSMRTDGRSVATGNGIAAIAAGEDDKTKAGKFNKEEKETRRKKEKSREVR